MIGIPEMIDWMVKHIPDADTGFTVLFNDTGLPNPDLVPIKLHEKDAGGNWYRCEQTGMQGRLCPALYNSTVPEKLFIKISS